MPPSPTVVDGDHMTSIDLHDNNNNGTNMSHHAHAHHNVPPPRQRISQRPGFAERRRSSILVGQRSIDLMAMEGTQPVGPRFVMFVIRQYRRWGYFIAEHDWKAIIVCLIISGFGLVKVIATPQQNDITGYSPYGARAREEYDRYQGFFAQNGLGVAVYIFALAKDGGSMIRDRHLKEVVRILDDANDNVTLYNAEKNSSSSYSDFCISFCNINEPVRQFYNGFRVQSELADKGEKLNGRLNLSYPISTFFGRSVTLQQSFFGIHFYNHTQDEILNGDKLVVNETSGEEEEFDLGKVLLDPAWGRPHVTNMESAKIIVLQFRAEHQSGWTAAEVKRYEMEMVDRFQKNYKSDLLQTYVLSQTYVEEEMVRAGISLLPYLSVGFLVMSACAVISVVVRALYMHQHSAPKILLAVMACILPFMSCASALGLMFTCGMRFASILCVIPFLVLAIGVDSSYLMIHEWQRVIKHCRDQPSRKNSNVGYRISELLSEVGPAILISALTNIFADGVGSFTSSPEITLLCVGNMISMAIAFIYQMTFYCGLFSIVGRYEIQHEREERREIQASIRAAQLAELSNGGAHGHRAHPPLTRQQSKFHDNTKHVISKSMLAYVNFVATKAVAVFTVIVYFIYLFVAIWGITRIDINLTTQKLFSADSPLLRLDQLRVEYQVPHFTMATFFVTKPGNLSDPNRLYRMNKFVDDLEHINGSWGAVGTQYFVRDFINFENSFEDNDFADEEEEPENPKDKKSSGYRLIGDTANGPFNEEDLKNFIEWPEYSYWNGFIKLNDNKKKLVKFFFTTAYHGKQLSVWTERGKLLQTLRDTVDRYTGDFDVSVFHEDGVFLDLIDNMPTDTWQSVLGTLICMGAVCFLFLNSIFTVVIASSCVLSICAGILGYLSWMSIDLDPITMAAMIISIGCSVDIPAHVSYHYYQASVRELNSTPQSKLVNCLSSVAFPSIQAGTSTILCVCSLLFVHIYMAEVFVKTMVLCVVLCNIHGLVFLPAFLILFDSIVQKVRQLARQTRRKRHVHGEDSAVPSRMGGEPPAASIATHKRQEFANKNHQRTNGSGAQDHEYGSPPHRHLSRISSKTENSVSTICDRPDVNNFPPDPNGAKPSVAGGETPDVRGGSDKIVEREAVGSGQSMNENEAKKSSESPNV